MTLVSERPTNENLLSCLGVEGLEQAVWDRLRALATGPFTDDPEEDVRLNRCDPVRVFVKNELHSATKVSEGRLRLIMSISVVDQLVERVLCEDQNEAEIRFHSDIPSKPGMGLDDEGLDRLMSAMAEFEDPVETDMSGYDWSVAEWMLVADAAFRTMAKGLGADSAYARLIAARVKCLARSVLVFSDGSIFTQSIPGVQKSGSYNTSSTNSRIRVMLGYLAGSSKLIAMGDDAVEEYSSEAFRKYRELGMKPKMYTRVSLVTGIEFCATVFSSLFAPRPVRWQRMLATLLQTTPQTLEEEETRLCALQNELRHSPAAAEAFDIISRAGWGFPGKPNQDAPQEEGEEESTGSSC